MSRLQQHERAARAPRQEGPRTTLRLPVALASRADLLGSREGISRNEAVVRLAEIGAEQQQRLDAIGERGEKRLVAWRARERPRSREFPTADELEAAVALARGDDAEAVR